MKRTDKLALVETVKAELAEKGLASEISVNNFVADLKIGQLSALSAMMADTKAVKALKAKADALIGGYEYTG